MTTSTFTVQLTEDVVFEENAAVGTLYEVGINGVGYMLYDNMEGQEYRYERSSVSLDPPRFATSDTPFSEAIERYTFAGYTDWVGGRGQRWRDRPSSVDEAFWDSDGVDPFTHGQVALLKATGEHLADSYAGLRLVVVGDDLYVLTADDELTYYGTPLAAADGSFTITGTPVVTDLTTDGFEWYAAAGADGIFRGTTSDPGSAWSAVVAETVEWAGARICAAYPAGTSSTPNRFTTINDAGTEEVGGGRLTLPEEWTIASITGGNGKVWFTASSGDRGEVFVWNLTSDAPFSAFSLPQGEAPTAVCWYQGQVLVRASRARSGGANVGVIYRCVPGDDGTLTPFLLAELDEAVDEGPGAFAAQGRRVLFSWPSMGSGTSGLGAVDLSSGGYAKWLRSDDTGPVSDVAVWQGYAVFSVVGVGVFVETDTFLETGYVQLSALDGASGLQKVFDGFTVTALPLTTGESITFERSLDGWSSDAELTGLSMTTIGQQVGEFDLGLSGRSLGLRVVLNGDSSSSPTLTMVQVKMHAVSASDEIVQIPVNCANEIRLLNGADDPANGPRAGASRARTLLALQGSRVLFQDVDWHLGNPAETFEVVQVRQFKTSLYASHTGDQRLQWVVVLTLRKES